MSEYGHSTLSPLLILHFQNNTLLASNFKIICNFVTLFLLKQHCWPSKAGIYPLDGYLPLPYRGAMLATNSFGAKVLEQASGDVYFTDNQVSIRNVRTEWYHSIQTLKECFPYRFCVGFNGYLPLPLKKEGFQPCLSERTLYPIPSLILHFQWQRILEILRHFTPCLIGVHH